MSGVALVIGGGSGIGAAIALQLADQGHLVAIADLSQQAAEVSAQALQGAGHMALECDISDEAAVRGCFDQVESELGSVRVLAITAGHPGLINGKRPSVRETSLQSWCRVFEVNATGSFLAIREMLIRRDKAPVEHGRIITISSIAAQSGGKNAPITYASSKAAILAMTRIAAREGEALGLTVNAIAPGMIDTPMLRGAFPPGDPALDQMPGPIGRPGDIAAVACFLASPEARFITGACIDSNGGTVMR